MNRKEYRIIRQEFLEKLVDSAGISPGYDRSDAFLREYHAKQRTGDATYGDASFDAPLDELFYEVMQECVDIPGWCTIIYAVLKKNGANQLALDQVVDLAAFGWDAYVEMCQCRKLLNVVIPKGMAGNPIMGDEIDEYQTAA